ncbi:hypothetical protein MSG28_000082 [Choristoneura fumiferana]|uniref:Uncharacterized protein n=1 Tax=Choristoneura fumiferana TaxID=7141 RepID=A0ACC0JZ45_CHOFU|nr:hypothetical protein MSG28_000082 [Choristoneura fumiferana]
MRDFNKTGHGYGPAYYNEDETVIPEYDDGSSFRSDEHDAALRHDGDGSVCGLHHHGGRAAVHSWRGGVPRRKQHHIHLRAYASWRGCRGPTPKFENRRLCRTVPFTRVFNDISVSGTALVLHLQSSQTGIRRMQHATRAVGTAHTIYLSCCVVMLCLSLCL